MCCEAAHDGDIFHVSGEQEAGRAGRVPWLPQLPPLPSQAARLEPCPGLAAVPAAGGPGTQPRSCPLLELCAGPVPLPRAWTLRCALQEQRVLWWGGEEFPSGDIRTRGCCGNTGSCSSHCALPACGVRALIPEIVQHFWIFISMWYAG